MFNLSSIRSICLAATILALTASGAAYAQPESVTRQVSTHGLNLTSPSGRWELRLQVRRAARDVCKQVTGGQDPNETDFQSCFDVAYTNAWAQAKTQIASAENRRSMLASNATLK